MNHCPKTYLMLAAASALTFACGGEEPEVGQTSSAAMCYPNWVLVSDQNPICHIDRDGNRNWFYDLEFNTQDSYVDTAGCYSGYHYIKREVVEIDCFNETYAGCMRDELGYWLNDPPVNDDQCDNVPAVNNNPVCRADADCNDGQFCTGTEYCDAGVCRHRNRPCIDPDIACNEYTDRCELACGLPGMPICR